MRETGIEYYMGLPYRIEIVPDAEEGGVALRCPELSGCITCAENLDEGYAMLEDAKRAWFLSCLENGIEIPKPKEVMEEIILVHEA